MNLLVTRASNLWDAGGAQAGSVWDKQFDVDPEKVTSEFIEGILIQQHLSPL